MSSSERSTYEEEERHKKTSPDMKYLLMLIGLSSLVLAGES
jgi:hypothetical protein